MTGIKTKDDWLCCKIIILKENGELGQFVIKNKDGFDYEWCDYIFKAFQVVELKYEYI